MEAPPATPGTELTCTFCGLEPADPRRRGRGRVCQQWAEAAADTLAEFVSTDDDRRAHDLGAALADYVTQLRARRASRTTPEP